MLSSFLRSVQSSIGEIEHISIRAATSGLGCEVRVRSEESANAICHKVGTLGMTGKIIGHYPSLDFWLVLITKSPTVDQNQKKSPPGQNDES